MLPVNSLDMPQALEHSGADEQRSASPRVTYGAAGRRHGPDQWSGFASAALYALAGIRRGLSEFSETGLLLAESIAIEQKLSGADSPEVTRRLVEMSLVLAPAGQGRWQQRTEVLERVIPHAHRMTAKKRASLGDIVKRRG